MHGIHKVAGHREKRLKDEKSLQCQAKEFYFSCVGEREPCGISRKMHVF